MTITDEMLKVAIDAYWMVPVSDDHRDYMRAALQAVAPLLIAPHQRALEACNAALANSGKAYALALADRNKARAEGLREAIEILCQGPVGADHIHAKNIYDRAEELDPQLTEQGKLGGEDGRNVAWPCREEDAPQPNIITDAMVEKARDEFERYEDVPPYQAMKAALEAVATMLIAHGMREAAAMCAVMLTKQAREIEQP